MRELAKRIERATRDDFITHEEGISQYASQIFEDRDRIWSEIQELKEEGKSYKEARSTAVENFIFYLLEDNCIRTSYKNLVPKLISSPIQASIDAIGMDDIEDEVPEELVGPIDSSGTKIMSRIKEDSDGIVLNVFVRGHSTPTIEIIDEDVDVPATESKKIKKKRIIVELPEEELD